MEVIIIKDTDKIGRIGQVVKVKDGYARNFLIPNGLAVPATAGNIKKLDQEKEKRSQESERLKQEALSLKEKIEKLSVTLSVLTQEGDALYGSITAQDIFNAVSEEGLQIDKKCILLAEPIKALGIYEIPVELHPEVSSKIKVWIVKK